MGLRRLEFTHGWMSANALGDALKMLPPDAVIERAYEREASVSGMVVRSDAYPAVPNGALIPCLTATFRRNPDGSVSVTGIEEI